MEGNAMVMTGDKNMRIKAMIQTMFMVPLGVNKMPARTAAHATTRIDAAVMAALTRNLDCAI